MFIHISVTICVWSSFCSIFVTRRIWSWVKNVKQVGFAVVLLNYQLTLSMHNYVRHASLARKKDWWNWTVLWIWFYVCCIQGIQFKRRGNIWRLADVFRSFLFIAKSCIGEKQVKNLNGIEMSRWGRSLQEIFRRKICVLKDIALRLNIQWRNGSKI